MKSVYRSISLAIPGKVHSRYLHVCINRHLIQQPYSRTMPISFHWECKAPFQITPLNGTLNPRESVKIQATFRPSLACIYKDLAVCHYNEEYAEKIHLEGTGTNTLSS